MDRDVRKYFTHWIPLEIAGSLVTFITVVSVRGLTPSQYLHRRPSCSPSLPLARRLSLYNERRWIITWVDRIIGRIKWDTPYEVPGFALMWNGGGDPASLTQEEDTRNSRDYSFLREPVAAPCAGGCACPQRGDDSALPSFTECPDPPPPHSQVSPRSEGWEGAQGTAALFSLPGGNRRSTMEWLQIRKESSVDPGGESW